jgi:hypothetical protein
LKPIEAVIEDVMLLGGVETPRAERDDIASASYVALGERGNVERRSGGGGIIIALVPRPHPDEWKQR